MLRRSSHMVAMKEDQSSDNNGRHLMMGDRRGSVLNQSFEKRSMYAPRKSIFLGRRASYMSRKSSESYGLPKVKLQNTYRIELKENEKFNPSLVKPKMNDILEGALKDQEYNASNANILSKEISQDIVREIRTIAHGISPRYKIVSHVSIGQLKDQDCRIVSRCLWDDSKDNSATVTFKNASIYAVATIFAVYFE